MAGSLPALGLDLAASEALLAVKKSIPASHRLALPIQACLQSPHQRAEGCVENDGR